MSAKGEALELMSLHVAAMEPALHTCIGAPTRTGMRPDSCQPLVLFFSMSNRKGKRGTGSSLH